MLEQATNIDSGCTQLKHPHLCICAHAVRQACRFVRAHLDICALVCQSPVLVYALPFRGGYINKCEASALFLPLLHLTRRFSQLPCLLGPLSFKGIRERVPLCSLLRCPNYKVFLLSIFQDERKAGPCLWK